MERMIIGITGSNGAGKGTIVEYLKKQKKFEHFSASGLITEEILRRNMPVNRDSMIEVANDLRAKYGSGYIVEELLRRAGESKENTIVESIRTLGEVDKLKKVGGILLAVDADQKIRYERILKRGSEKDNVSFEEFAEQERKESESDDPNRQNLSACRQVSDFVVNNDGKVKELEEQIEKILKIIQNNDGQ